MPPPLPPRGYADPAPGPDPAADLFAPNLLQAFVAVAENGTFTGAARALGLRQSTISQQVRRLEENTARRLFDRNTHRVALTPAGEALLDHARRILAAHEQMRRHLAGGSLRGRLRLGASEDFVLSALPDVLAAFAQRHPEVDLEVTAGLSETLVRSFDAGQLDILLVKRGPRDRRGTPMWREQASWLGRPDLDLDPAAPLPLLLFPSPSITRAMAVEALEQAGRAWRVAFTSGSLSALSAAARAGLGVMAHSARLAPAGLSVLPSGPHLPVLGDIEFVVIEPGGRHPVAEALAAGIHHWVLTGRTSGTHSQR